MPAHPRPRAQRAASGWRCTCTPATATCTNIPVNSDNLRDAADRARGGRPDHHAGAQPGRRDLRRARHRHPKLEFLSDEELAGFTDYKRRVDPEGRFKAASCCAAATSADLTNAYTPSFRADGPRVALIMEQSDISQIADSVKDCLRCGKVQTGMHHALPRANLLYSPRNKILATSLLIEAFLYYEGADARGVSIKHWRVRTTFADHCTVCHKCLAPCPVKIDFGDVSMACATCCARWGRRASARQRGGDVLPQRHQPRDHQADAQRAMVGIGFRAQRFANNVLRGPRNRQTAAPAGDGGPRSAQSPAGDPLHQQEDARWPAERTARALLDIGMPAWCPSSATRRRPRPIPGGVLLPPAAARSGCSRRWAGDAGDALARRRADRCCRPATCAAAIRNAVQQPVRQGREDDHRQPRAVPPRRQHAELLDIKTVVVRLRHHYDQLQGYKFRRKSSQQPNR